MRWALLGRTGSPHIRVDPSLAAALGAGPDALLADLNLLRQLFENLLSLLSESLVVRDLRILAGPLRGRVHHYRDALGLKADATTDLYGGVNSSTCC